MIGKKMASIHEIMGHSPRSARRHSSPPARSVSASFSENATCGPAGAVEEDEEEGALPTWYASG